MTRYYVIYGQFSPEVWIYFCQFCDRKPGRELFLKGSEAMLLSHLPDHSLVTTNKCMSLPPVNIISISYNCPSLPQTKCCCAEDYRRSGTYVSCL